MAELLSLKRPEAFQLSLHECATIGTRILTDGQKIQLCFPALSMALQSSFGKSFPPALLDLHLAGYDATS